MSTLKPSRSMISIFMLFGFLTILITGFLSFGLRYNAILSAVHTIFGLSFVLFGVFHLKNNLRPLINYLKIKKGKRISAICGIFSVLTIVGVIFQIPPFQTIIDAGYAIKELSPIDRQITETLHTHIDRNGKKLMIDIKAGPHYSGPGAVILGVTTTGTPQMAIWLEDLKGNYLETLYVTKKASNGSYLSSLFDSKEVRRPEALPHWAFSRGVKSEDGLYVPSVNNPIVDAVTGATPLASFELNTTIEESIKYDEVVVKLEINRSFDYNKFYHKDAFPEDDIYSGSGNTAQPSLIYATTINTESSNPYYFMSLIGHGHYSGKDGKIYSDSKEITTAKEMLSRIIVEVLKK